MSVRQGLTCMGIEVAFLLLAIAGMVILSNPNPAYYITGRIFVSAGTLVFVAAMAVASILSHRRNTKAEKVT